MDVQEGSAKAHRSFFTPYISLFLPRVGFSLTRICRGLFLFFLWPLHVVPSRRAELWVESGRVQRGWRGRALNDVEEARGGCLLVLRHNLLVFITDDARKLLSFSLSSSTAILRHLYFRRLAPFLRFCPDSSALVFRRNTINHFSRSAGMTPPLHPRLSSKRACFVNDESFRLPDECVIFQVTIIVRSHTWVCHIASWILLSHGVSSMFRHSKWALH